MNESDDIAFARGGITSPFGSLTAEIAKFKIPEETKDRLGRLAREAGLNTTEYVRYLVMLRVHGVESMVSVEQARLKIIAGMGSESGA